MKKTARLNPPTSIPLAAEEAILNAELEPPEPRVERLGAPDNRPLQYRPESRLKSIIERRIMPGILTNRFKHSPIHPDEIRLLQIRRGAADDHMFCVIFKRKLVDVKQRYEALSYCWGNSKADCEIHIQDLNVQPPSGGGKLTFEKAAELKGPRRFFVRPNLYAAMTHLRKENRDVTIWIDAICIDQSREGEDEKRMQLARMAEIYNSAFNVCIWLGEADIQGRSDSAMQLVRKVTNFHTFDKLMDSPEARSQWNDLIELMKSPWFSRRWVVQEVVLARRASVHCGVEVIHWDDLCDAISLLNDKAERLRDRFGDYDVLADVEGLSASILVKSLNDVCRKNDDGTVQEHLMGLETLVSTLLTFENSNSHDTIFSLLSIAKDTPQSFIPGSVNPSLDPEKRPFQFIADYKMSPRDLYIEFMQFCVETSESLDIICRHWAPPIKDAFDRTILTPSWISSLSNMPFGLPGETQGRQNGENFVRCFGRDSRKRYNASRGWFPDGFQFEKNANPQPSRSRAVSTAAKTNGETAASLDAILEEPQKKANMKFYTQEAAAAERRPSLPDRPRIVTNLHADFSNTEGYSPAPPSASTTTSTKDIQREDLYRGILHVSGIKLGRITSHSDLIRRGIIPGDWLSYAGWSNSKSQNRVPDRLWRTLVADRTPDGGSPPAWYQRACLHCLVDTRITDRHGNLNVSSYHLHRTAEMTVQFLKRVESVVWNRRFFRGGNNGTLFGLAPQGTKGGDWVCILFGCTVPVILRETDGTGDSLSYQVIGEAYVHGKMDGEAVADKEAVNSLVELFHLK